MTTYATERDYIAKLLIADWTDGPINWPNDELAEFPGRTLPQPTGDRTDPARWLNLDIAYQSAEQITFDGDIETRGTVYIRVLVEAGVGDGRMRAMCDTLVEIFRAGDDPTDARITFLEPDLGESTYEDDWYVRQIDIPFIRFKN